MGAVLNRNALADVLRRDASFGRLTRQIGEKTERMAVRVADEKVQRKTGKYAGNFETVVTPIFVGLVVARIRLFNSVAYAVIIEEGSRPHRIPRSGLRLLVFEAGGDTVFTQFVNHPGTRPQHVVREALQRIARGAAA